MGADLCNQHPLSALGMSFALCVSCHIARVSTVAYTERIKAMMVTSVSMCEAAICPTAITVWAPT